MSSFSRYRRSAIGRTASTSRPSAFSSPTWNAPSPGRSFSLPPFLPRVLRRHLRPASGLVHLIFGPFSHRHWFSDRPRFFAVPHVENSQWNSPRRTRFLPDSLSERQLGEFLPSRSSPLATGPKYDQMLFRFLMANYVIAARRDRKRDASRTESR